MLSLSLSFHNIDYDWAIITYNIGHGSSTQGGSNICSYRLLHLLSGRETAQVYYEYS